MKKIARTDYLKRESMEHVLAALMPENRLVLELCMATGLRVGDVLALRTDELRKRQTVTESKTGKTRRIVWPYRLYPQMVAGAGEVWVFPHRTDPARHRSRSAVYKDVKRAAALFRASGVVPVGVNVGTHSARKLYAVEKYHKTDLQTVQRALNHSSSAVTMLYALADELTARKTGGRSR